MKALNQRVVLIVGLGQIGGSIGIDLVQKRLVAKVIGFDYNKAVLKEAERRKIVDTTVSTLEEGLRLADLVIFAVPIRVIIAILPSLSRLIDKNKDIGVLDVAGTKVQVLKTASSSTVPMNYIGGHPIAGSEGSGLDAVKSGRFADIAFILVPQEQTKKRWLDTMKSLVIGLGARPILMNAQQHDRLIALTSHLPHVLSLALLDMAMKYGENDSKTWDLVGGSFTSATRVAASSTDLIVDMLLTNPHPISAVVDEMIAELSILKGIIEGDNESDLRTYIEKVQKKAGELQQPRN